MPIHANASTVEGNQYPLLKNTTMAKENGVLFLCSSKFLPLLSKLLFLFVKRVKKLKNDNLNCHYLRLGDFLGYVTIL